MAGSNRSNGNDRLFDEPTLRKLEQLRLVADRVRAGLLKGDRRSRKRGSSVEFADYRDYVRGDDLRRLDWNVYARLERPFIKLLEEEEDLAVHLLLDGSRSMDWPAGRDDLNKFDYARRLLAALAIIGLAAGDQVRIALLSADQERAWGPYRGRGSTMRLLQLLEPARAQGVTDLNHGLRRYALRALRPGLLIVISDLFSPNGFMDGLAALQARGYEIALIQVLSPDEVLPSRAGDVRLVDVETGRDAEVTLDHATIDRYLKRFQAWQLETAAYCGRRGIHYIPVTSELPWQTLVMQTLRAQGVVR
jgi:uncharacterized protein (DUF58 family)